MLVDAAGEPIVCVTCGRALGGRDGDEDATGDAGQPICGECARERDFFDLEVEMQESDGDRDA
jgi:hypothetical protein